MSYRFLALSKDTSWLDSVRRALAGQPGRLDAVASLPEAWSRAFAGETDLLLLDLELPAAERLGWFRSLRAAEGGRPVAAILASARKSDDELAEAFELGADDFVGKDCEPAELLARLRSALRRRYGRAEAASGVLAAGPVTLDLGRHECRVRGRRIALNPREFELLETLLRKAGRVLSRPFLLEAVWGMSAEASTRAVDVTVSRLRKALGSRAGAWVETVERYGYRFRG